MLFLLYLPAFVLAERCLVRDSQDQLRLGIALLLSMPVLGVVAVWLGRRRFLRERSVSGEQDRPSRPDVTVR